MNIAIIGSGHIGAGLARAWAAKGHSITFGVREPESTESLALAQELGARMTLVSDAPKDAHVVVLAIPHRVLEWVVEQLGDLADTIVIDCTNAVARGMTLQHGHTTSAAEELQKRIPKAHVFKSFNAQGAENLAQPIYNGQAASNFYCGNDPEAKNVVHQLVADVGFDPVDAGPLQNARFLEPLMVLWVTASQALGTRDLAFKLMRR